MEVIYLSDTNKVFQDILQMKDIDVMFPGVHALNRCSFTLRNGEIHALVGENGAGKSTLMKVLTGIYTDYEGEIIFNNQTVRFNSVKDAQLKGISIVHQELNLLNHLTVAQNIFIGRESEGFFLNDKIINEKTNELIGQFRINIKPTDKISSLSVGKLQMVEIARAMSYPNTKILILDEPTAALSDKETVELFEKIRELKAKGIAVIFISHRMAELKKIADRITVLRDGEYVGTAEADSCEIPNIIRMMVGRTILQEPKTASAVLPDAPVVLEARNLVSPVIKDVSFQLRKGEILGFAGLVGAGRTEVMRLIFCADPKASGEVLINGKPVKMKLPQDAVSNGIGYLSEDRKRFGLMLRLSLLDNVILGSIDKLISRGLIRGKKSQEVVNHYISELKIKTPSLRQLVQFLSGGNQQKVVVAKWLLMDTDILIFDEPTRGIDVGAKSEIYDLMNTLAAEGKSIIMISSELSEILRMSDRIIVMSEGRKSGELAISEASQEKIMELATQFIGEAH